MWYVFTAVVVYCVMVYRETGRLSASPGCTVTAGSSLSLLPGPAAASLLTASHCAVADHHHRAG